MGGVVFAAIAPHGYLAIPEACMAEDSGIATATQQAMAVITAGNLAGPLARWVVCRLCAGVSDCKGDGSDRSRHPG